MILVVFAVVLIVIFPIFAYANNNCMDFLEAFSGVVGAFVLLAFVIGLIAIPFCYMGTDGKIAAYEARYESLVYQYENDIYDNDNDLGKRDLMTDIEAWNTELARKKANQDDLWIGIYIPNIYDQFEFIELKGE